MVTAKHACGKFQDILKWMSIWEVEVYMSLYLVPTKLVACARVWFSISNHGSHRLGCCYREREVIIWNFTLHYTLLSRCWGACPDTSPAEVVALWLWWWLACVVHSCQVSYWQVGNCGYRLHAINCWVLLPTYLLAMWCQSIFKRSQNFLLCLLLRWCETPSVIQQQQKKKWVFW